MKKNDARGWKNVFGFTLTQTLKSKSYLVTMVFMLFMALVAMPLVNYLLADSTDMEKTESSIQKVYVLNMTFCRSLDIAAEVSGGYKHIAFEEARESYEALETKLTEETDSVILVLMEDEANCYIQFTTAPDGPVGNYELQILGQFVQNAYRKAKVKLLGVSEEQMAYLNTGIVATATVVDTKSAVVLEDTSISQSEYWFIYGLLFIVLMISIMGSSQVATSVVSEKSSRVVEYLLTSIRPMAVIIGKVLAMLVAVMMQIILVLAAGFLSSKLSERLLGTGTDVIGQYISPEILANLNPLNILFGLLATGMGLVFYATLAGLCGATVSRMEEASEGLMLLTFASLIGAYLGMGAAGTLMSSGSNPFVTFALIFPLSSAFLLPGALLVGRAHTVVVVIALVVLLASILLLFRFVAQVYEGLILHNGNRLKIKDVLAMSKNRKG